MRTFLFGIILGALAGLLYAPSTGTRTRSLIKDKYGQYSHDTVDLLDKRKEDLRDRYDQVSMRWQQQAGPLKDRIMDLREDVKSRLIDVRGKIKERVGQIKEQIKEVEKQEKEEDKYRQSA